MRSSSKAQAASRELNLREHDLVNLGLVTRIQAPWILVADIERGGVFASVIGTAHLLSPEERALFRGFAINKFRGDVSLFDDGVRDAGAARPRRRASACSRTLRTFISTPRTAWRCRLARRRPRRLAPASAIVRFPHLSNATDFRLLTWADWIAAPSTAEYDFIILPGSKNTIADLTWLRERRPGRLDPRAASVRRAR